MLPSMIVSESSPSIPAPVDLQKSSAFRQANFK